MTDANEDWRNHPVLAGIRANEAELRAEEQNSDQERRLSARTVELLREIGVMRVIQPARYGGFEADPRVFNEACHLLGQYAPAAGWVLGVVGVHQWNLGLFSDRVQQQVWGDDTDVWVSASYGPAGRAVPVEGGLELTGRWGFSSGSDHCRWALVGGLSQEDGRMVYRHYLVERDTEYEVVDVWHASGLPGSGSNDLVVEKKVIPYERAMDTAELYALQVPGLAVNTGPLYRIPWYTLFVNAISMPMVGMARGIVDETRSIFAERAAADPAKVPGQATLVRLASADANADLAYTVLQTNLSEAWAAVQADEQVSMRVRGNAKRDHILAVEAAVRAGNEAYAIAGPRAIHNAGWIQKAWRDLNAGNHHAMNLPEGAWTQYGQYLVTGEHTGLI
ncbi:3-hydroxy-9,10-secoandrosta-1,3,5(10)-triene-9,17-dione monooxygenase oxygenase subunit [Enemella sp. A6]|uniref:3-hydroxy-9,10-secoandrosta-1,3,5(10)-triene-9, 17-dione monooxygenase oxygenase subunit n=1 Tax=Enemella sp. A6 TaxID=3440152 RepID=UPI003EBDEEBD